MKHARAHFEAETAHSQAVDSVAFRSAMGRFATGVTVITYRREGAASGMTANAFLSVSMDPLLVLVSVRRSSQFNHHVKLGDRYGVNFLCACQQSLSAQFCRPPAIDANVPLFYSLDTPLIEGCLANAVARVVDIHGAGDHWLYIAQVESLHQGTQTEPLIFYGGAYQLLRTQETGHFASAST